MKLKRLIYLFFLLPIFLHPIKGTAQNNIGAFGSGEWLKYKLRYGFINAGYTTLEVKDTLYLGKTNFLIDGKGWTTGVTKLFYKIEDSYQSIVDKKTLFPYFSKRRVNEGGYKILHDVYFNQYKGSALVIDYKRNTEKSFDVVKGVQDMISSMYFVRNTDFANFKIGQEITVDLFYDNQLNNFKLRFLGREIINTKFGKIRTLKFKPFVESGRVFKDQNSVVVWVTDDENKIPIKIKADLMVGSLNAELEYFKGLLNAFPIIFNK